MLWRWFVYAVNSVTRCVATLRPALYAALNVKTACVRKRKDLNDLGASVMPAPSGRPSKAPSLDPRPLSPCVASPIWRRPHRVARHQSLRKQTCWKRGKSPWGAWRVPSIQSANWEFQFKRKWYSRSILKISGQPNSTPASTSLSNKTPERKNSGTLNQQPQLHMIQLHTTPWESSTRK